MELSSIVQFWTVRIMSALLNTEVPQLYCCSSCARSAMAVTSKLS